MEHKPAPQSFALDSETAHAILDSALDAHILMSHTGTNVGWNPQSERIFGWQAEEVLGRRLSDVIIPPIYREAHERGIRTFQETGRGAVLGKRIEIEGLHRDQRLFPIELTVTSVETPGGLVFSAFIRDITARKEAEQSLKEAKERAEQAARDRAGILAAVDVFFIYVDSNGLVTEWTAMAEQTFSLSRNAVLGRRLTDLPIPWNWSEVVGMMRGPGERKKVPLRQGDGTERLIGMTVTSIQQGQGTGYIFMGKDITEQVKLDHDIAQSQKLESIGQLAAGIAHEINTPTQIEACEAAIREADLNYLLSEIPQAIFQSLEGISRVGTIVQAMKEFAHPGTHEKIAVNLNNAIRSTVTVASNEWKYVADMRTNLDESLPPVPCLVGQFNQVVLNIIVNAAHAIADIVKGTGTKGTITVSTRREGDSAEIRIADTGGGIPEAIRSKIFDPFFTTKEVGKGTGQGLAIARSVVVDKHGGTITAESELGQGTTFVIRLPLASQPGLASDQHPS